MSMDVDTDERIELVNNTTPDHRNCYYTFARNNNYVQNCSKRPIKPALCHFQPHLKKRNALFKGNVQNFLQN